MTNIKLFCVNCLRPFGGAEKLETADAYPKNDMSLTRLNGPEAKSCLSSECGGATSSTTIGTGWCHVLS